nr:MAG TPA: stabilization protein [Crassvirales sp.]
MLNIDDDEAVNTSNSYYLKYDLSSNHFIPVYDLKPEIHLPNAYDIISNCGFPQPEKVTHGNAITSSCIRSLKRGETYRYGIILYKNDGTRSDVIWIGDIRIPHPGIIELNNLGTIQIGIEFTLNDAFKPFAIKNNISGYEIVRC